jgi:hypothetical protein
MLPIVRKKDLSRPYSHEFVKKILGFWECCDCGVEFIPVRGVQSDKRNREILEALLYEIPKADDSS